jgi:hypothetical protein
MKKIYSIFVISLLLITVNCKTDDYEQNKSVISFEDIQGVWMWDSVKHIDIYNYTDVLRFKDTELRIYSTDTCEFYYGYYKNSHKYLIKYKEPDTLAIFSCPIGFMCDPWVCWKNFKIIEFDKTKKMIIRCDGKLDKCGNQITIKYFSKPN